MSRSIYPVFAAALAAMSMTVLAGAAKAQTPAIEQLLNRVERLQREITTLQRQVYKGGTPPAAAAPPTSAARAPAPIAVDTRTAARTSVRMTQLENEMRSLTGRIEEVDHRLRQIQTRLEKLVGDVDQRLAAIEAGTRPGAVAGFVAPPGAPGAPAAPGAAVPTPPAGQPGVLGVIPRDLAVTAPTAAAPVVAAAPKTVLPKGTPKSQYDFALGLMLQKQDFAAAEMALREFIGLHPKHKLAGNAHYWLGETFYVRKIYQDAAFTFAEGFQKYPRGIKAPDSLLKLGMSLHQLDKRKEACTAFSRLLAAFPTASGRLKARVKREQNRSKCG